MTQWGNLFAIRMAASKPCFIQWSNDRNRNSSIGIIAGIPSIPWTMIKSCLVYQHYAEILATIKFPHNKTLSSMVFIPWIFFLSNFKWMIRPSRITTVYDPQKLYQITPHLEYTFWVAHHSGHDERCPSRTLWHTRSLYHNLAGLWTTLRSFKWCV